jgi:hypothetical protein
MLDAMDDANRAAKTMLRHFKPTIQAEYVLLQQLESIADTKWNTMSVTKPKEHDINVAHEFVAGTSILEIKW